MAAKPVKKSTAKATPKTSAKPKTSASKPKPKNPVNSKTNAGNTRSLPSKYGDLASAEYMLAKNIGNGGGPISTYKKEQKVDKVRKSIGMGPYEGFYKTAENNSRGIYQPVGNPYKKKVQEKNVSGTRKVEKVTNASKKTIAQAAADKKKRTTQGNENQMENYRANKSSNIKYTKADSKKEQTMAKKVGKNGYYIDAKGNRNYPGANEVTARRNSTRKGGKGY